MLLEILILILAVPAGYILAYLTKDELVQGRIWFKMIILVSAVLAGIFLFLDLAVSLTLAFVLIVTLICLIKSHDKRFVK